MKKWKFNSWENFEAKHLPEYNDKNLLDEVKAQISSFPPLIFPGEVEQLKKDLTSASLGKGFILQAGDCAESFTEFNADNIKSTFQIILQMGIILTSAINLPVTKIGRIAGQFAKPRSNKKETKSNQQLESYKGDIINDVEFDFNKRKPDPSRMLKAYSQAASTLNLLRAYSSGGLADLKNVNKWNMGFINNKASSQRYKKVAIKIKESLEFMNALGINSDNTPQLKEISFYTSHEGLLLPYEEALLRTSQDSEEIYATSAHMIWIGDRTRFKESAHVEFCRGLANPIGIKCSFNTDIDELLEIIDILNPSNENGKIILIARYGYKLIEKYLPDLIKRINQEGKNVLWSCDPMHGNTTKSSDGIKTRSFENILNEVKKNLRIHKSEGSIAGGIHLEMTGQNVTECTGGIDNITETNLSLRYHTHCDPRLNASQSIEMAFLIADELINEN